MFVIAVLKAAPQEKTGSQTYALACLAVPRRKIRYPILCRHVFADQKSQTRIFRQDSGHCPGYYEDRLGQNCLQHASLSVPEADQRAHVARQG